MKSLFKKKKSDTKLAPQPIQYEPAVKKTIVMVDTPLQAPPLMMPKPKRALTPTRAILGRFDNDKTEVEDSPLQDISPILLPTAHHDPPLPSPLKSLQQQLSTLSVTGSDDSSRIYESAVESPSTTRSNSRQEVIDLPEFPPSAALAQQQQQRQQQPQQEQNSAMTSMVEEQQEFKRQQEFMRQQQERERQELILQQQELERQQELKRKQEFEKNQDLIRQQEFERQQQESMRQQQELERKEYIEKQKQLELEHLKTQMQKQNQFQEHQYHEHQLQQQQKHQFQQQQQLQQQINTQSGISDASSRTASPSQRHYAQRSSASSATATPMVKGTTPQASEEQEILNELKRQLEKMERQRARDREEWRRKEAELMTHSNQMMEKLKETEGQLSMALKYEEEIRQRQKQQQQQLHQQQERVPYRSRSEEQIKHKRSVSRSSYHHPEDDNKKPPFNDGHVSKYPQEYTEEFIEEYPQEYPEDYYPESLSRRSSNGSHRFRRARSKSIETRQMDQPDEEDNMTYSRPHPRRSRSAGRPSVKSPAASMYYDDFYKDNPRYYSQVVPASEQAQYYNVRNDSVLDNRGYYRPYNYHTSYYSQHQPQYHSLRPTMAPSRSTQSIGYPGYYFR